MPFLLLGTDYLNMFWKKNWPLFLFFILVLISFNVFFVKNWKLFSLLEKEDWDGLSKVLFDRIFIKKSYSRRNIRLFINTSLLLADIPSIEHLEAELKEKKPKAIRKDAILFGAIKLLKNDVRASLMFFKEYTNDKNTNNYNWLNFYYAFTLILDKQPEEASKLLLPIIKNKDSILSLVSAYTLGFLCVVGLQSPLRDNIKEVAESRRLELLKLYPSDNSKSLDRWSKEMEIAKNEVHIVVLSKILDEAGSWLFKGAAL